MTQDREPAEQSDDGGKEQRARLQRMGDRLRHQAPPCTDFPPDLAALLDRLAK